MALLIEILNNKTDMFRMQSNMTQLDYEEVSLTVITALFSNILTQIQVLSLFFIIFKEISELSNHLDNISLLSLGLHLDHYHRGGLFDSLAQFSLLQ